MFSGPLQWLTLSTFRNNNGNNAECRQNHTTRFKVQAKQGYYLEFLPSDLMDMYIIVITTIGLCALAMAWLPSLLEDVPFSYAMLFVALGILLYSLPIDLPSLNPIQNQELAIRLSELGVTITLMGTGIKINRAFGWKNWKIPFLLVLVTMLFCIGSLFFLGWWALGLAPASAMLLGAALAPTDPVLAADVQVGPPSEEKEDHVRFSLTAEAGINDGMAFPFTWLAIALAGAATTGKPWFWDWLQYDLIYKIIAGVAMGYVSGRVLAFLVFRLPRKINFPKTRDGFVAIAATLLVYGLTEIIHGYGFIAVFVAGLTLSSRERHHRYHRQLHDFTDQIERLILVVLLLLFGGSISEGLFQSLTITGALVGLAFVFIIRPLFAFLTLWRQTITFREKVTISFFGIRGIGSFYYLAFALSQATFQDAAELWSVIGFVVLLSVVVHGTLASPVMRYLDLRRTAKDLEVV